MLTNIAIVEDNTAVRNMLRKWVDDTTDYRCVCTCRTMKEALTVIPRHQPDVVLMDIHLPDGCSGIACTTELRQQMPSLQVIILTVYKDHDLIFQALQAGACGYLLKRSSRDEIMKAIAEIKAGGAPMTGEIARMLVETFQTPPSKSGDEVLTPREMEILVLVAKGMTNKEIADPLNISYETVRNHLRHIYEKLHVRCRTEAVMKYMKSSGSSLSK